MQPWECTRCRKMNAPHASQCTCGPATVMPGEPVLTPPAKPSRTPFERPVRDWPSLGNNPFGPTIIH